MGLARGALASPSKRHEKILLTSPGNQRILKWVKLWEPVGVKLGSFDFFNYHLSQTPNKTFPMVLLNTIKADRLELSGMLGVILRKNKGNKHR